MESNFYLTLSRIPILFLIILGGCVKSSSRPISIVSKSNDENYSSLSGFRSWWNENKENYTVEKTFGEVRYTIQYLPFELQYMDDKDGAESSDSVLLKDYEDQLYFILSIDCFDGKLPASVLNLVNQKNFEYWNFSFGNDIQAQVGDSTLICQSCTLESGFEIKNKLVFLISFRNKFKIGNQKIRLIIEDQALNKGKFEVEFPAELIRNIPNLN